jgi:hypothetical protein
MTDAVYKPDGPYADLVDALGALTEVPKTGKVAAGQRRYTFMTLPDLLGAVRPVFAAHHLAITQHVQNHDQGISVETRILHTSGHVFESPPLTLRCGQDPQAIGSAITYGRRYQLAALVGLAGGDDDDGREAATPPDTRAGPPPPDSRPAPPPDFTRGSIAPASASEKSRRAMWALLRETRMDNDSIRGWVSEVLSIDTDWHTAALSQQQVSTIIERLKAEARAGDTTQQE